MKLNKECEQYVEEYGIPRSFKLTAHVPEGMTPCYRCCGESTLESQPGMRTIPEPLSTIIQFCPFCAGTGICLPEEVFSADEYRQLERALHIREEFPEQMAALTTRYAFGLSILLLDRLRGSVSQLRRALQYPSSFRRLHPDDLLRPFHMLSALLYMPIPREELSRRLRANMEYPEGRRENLRLLEEWNGKAEQFLPAADCVEERLMQEWLLPMVMRVEDAHDQLLCKDRASFLFEEHMALLIVHDKWVSLGRPSGTRAETMVRDFQEAFYPERTLGTFTDEVLAGFECTELPPEFAGATPQLLAEVYEMVSKFGIQLGENHRRFDIRHPRDISVSVPIQSQGFRMMVMGGSLVGFEQCAPLVLRTGERVLWDRDVSVVDLQGFVTEARKIVSQGIMLDMFGSVPRPQSTLEQIFKPKEEQRPTPHFLVAEVFANPQTSMLVVPDGPDAETLRQQFDHPEQVAIHTTFLSGTTLCLASAMPTHLKRERVAFEVLKENGITTPEQLGELPFERIRELRTEIRRRVRCESPG